MQRLNHQFALLLLASFGVMVAPAFARADILGFKDFSEFTRNQSDSNSPPNLSWGKVEITNDTSYEARSIFYNTPQSISAFTASFTYQAIGGYPDRFMGAAFVLQNSAAGAKAVGPDAGNLGAGGISPSVAITLELATPTASGFYTGGVINSGSPATTPVNLLSGDLIDVTLVYNGGITLSETIVDGAATYSTIFSLPASLSAILGKPTAFVGFTANTIDHTYDQQYLSNFQFTTVPEPSSFVLLGVGGVGLLAYTRRRRQQT